MQFPARAWANVRPAPLPQRVSARSELDELRATCRSQALTITALEQAVSRLRDVTAALKAMGQNAEPRAECDRPVGGRRGAARASDRRDAGAAFAVRLPCDSRAPGAARIFVAHALGDGVAAGVLESAQLLVSELVTNSVRHSGAGPADGVIVRVSATRASVRLEIEDAGRGGVIAPRPPDPDNGGGFGLQLVQTLSQRWGLEHVTHGGTIAWVQLPRTPVTGGQPADAGGAPAALPPTNQRAGGHPRQVRD
jgi:anti-sigma regulatory factor (Ser/Thr protein kinase)